MIVVFGGNGQLGQELVREAQSRGIAIKPIAHAQADIGDRETVARIIAQMRPKLVINAAAYTKVDRAECETVQAQHANEAGPTTLAETCAALGTPLMHFSTDYVFDGSKREAYLENDPVHPLGSYGRSKAAGEAAVRRVLPQHIILRTSWVYGEFGQNFLKTILRLAATRDEIRVVADQRGNPTSTQDLARAVLRIAPRLVRENNLWGTYHYAGTGTTTWYSFAKRIVAAQAPLTNRNPTVTAISSSEYPSTAPRPANSGLNCEQFRRTFGFQPRFWGDEVDAITLALLATRGEQPRVT